MKYEYKVLNESDSRTLEMKLNQLGIGWKPVSVIWDYGKLLLVVCQIREK